MALAININDLLNKQKIESNRIEFKKGWNPVSIYHSVCAFANDYDDLGGGYIVAGVDTDEATGIAVRPVDGIPTEKNRWYSSRYGRLQQQDFALLYASHKCRGSGCKSVFVIWCPAGINRLYSVPEETLLLYTNIRNFRLSKSVLRKRLLLGWSKTAYGYAKGCF